MTEIYDERPQVWAMEDALDDARRRRAAALAGEMSMGLSETAPNWSETETDDGLASLGLASEGLTLVRKPRHEVPGDPVKLVKKIIEDRNLKRPSSGAPIL